MNTSPSTPLPAATRSMSLAEAYPIEQARIRELMDAYRAIGNPGAFGLMMLKDVLARADVAVANGDTVAMLRCYEEMKQCE